MMARHFYRLTGATAVIVLALSTGTLGAPGSAAKDLAQQHLAAGQPAEACAVLRSQASTTDPESLLMLGLCNEQLGNVAEAISFYERTLRIVPEATLVRARLAALYLVEGRTEEAEAELGVALSAALVSAAADPSTANYGMARLSVSRFYDSNVNAGSSATTMTGIVFGVPLPMTIDPASRAIRDSGTSLSVQGRHVTPLDANLALMMSGSLAATIHDSRSEYDRQTAGLGVGLLYGDGTVTAMVQPSLNVAFEAGEIDTVRSGLFGMAERELSEAVSIFATSEVAYRHNPEETDRSAGMGASH